MIISISTSSKIGTIYVGRGLVISLQSVARSGLMKGFEFLLKINSANIKKIRNGVKIHFMKFTLVLVIWKNPLHRVFPLFATNFISRVDFSSPK